MTRKINILLAAALTFLMGCDTPTSHNSTIINQDSNSTITTPTPKSVDTLTDYHTIWAYDYASEIPVKLREVNADTLTPKKLIDFINRYRGGNKIILDLVRISHDTIYLEIKESTYLTQSMGTTGADDYVSTTVYTLTELKGITYVNFNFEEGDHAAPGTYSRQYYIDRSNTTTMHE